MDKKLKILIIIVILIIFLILISAIIKSLTNNRIAVCIDARTWWNRCWSVQ